MASLIEQRWLFPTLSAVAALVVPVWTLWPQSSEPELPPELIPFGIDMPSGTPVGRAIMAMPFSSERDPSTQLAADDLAPVAGETATSPPSLVGLVGKVRGPEIALVRAADGTTSVVRSGEEIAGWKVEAIGRDSITFTMGGNRQVAKLDYGNRQDMQASPPSNGSAP